ncbi:MAG: response regulator transcription factor [Melioribacteraceae bacterium]|nr:response regulator transcription factor [Melioribacteraceae bacterium]MCF8395824.1 response regulator transcription factor [Melioribacteraceae bacterium]MCF8420918.1 response regulator transcription factor [Melioribacteraceae bacterium]
MINIFLADDHHLIREGIKKLISKEIDLKVVGETGNPFEVVSSIDSLDVDVLVLDLSLPGRHGLEVLKDVRSVYPDVKVLVLSMYSEEEYARRAFQLGAYGYITKDSSAEEILSAIRKIENGRKYISPKVAEILAESIDESYEESPHELLSTREDQVFRLIIDGKSNKEIAVELSLSVNTISTYKSRILEKFNLKSSADLVKYAIRNNLLK